MKRIISIFTCALLLATSSISQVSANIKKVDTYYESKESENYTYNSLVSSSEKNCLYIGQKIQLNIVNNKKGMEWEWTSSTSDVGTITTTGLIELKKKGTFKAQGVCFYDGKKYTINYAAIVKKPSIPINVVYLTKGQNFKINLIGAKVKKCVSTKKKIAKTTKKGNVTALKTGKTVIKVKDTNNNKYKIKIQVYKTKNKKHYNSSLK